jgi:hypothetical protein
MRMRFNWESIGGAFVFAFGLVAALLIIAIFA